MLDNLLLKIRQLSRGDSRQLHTHVKPIERIQYVNNKSSKLIVLFPQWKSDGKLTEIYQKRMAKNGYDTVIVHMNPQMLEANAKRVVESFMLARDVIKETLEDITKQRDHSYDNVQFVALSLGGVTANLVASEFSQFSKITYVVSGASLADGTWYSALTRDIRAELEEQSLNLANLNRKWQALDPAQNTKFLKNKRVVFIKSSKDIYVPPDLQQKLIDSIISSGADVLVKKTRLGHAATILRFYLLSSLDD